MLVSLSELVGVWADPLAEGSHSVEEYMNTKFVSFGGLGS